MNDCLLSHRQETSLSKLNEVCVCTHQHLEFQRLSITPKRWQLACSPGCRVSIVTDWTQVIAVHMSRCTRNPLTPTNTWLSSFMCVCTIRIHPLSFDSAVVTDVYRLQLRSSAIKKAQHSSGRANFLPLMLWGALEKGMLFFLSLLATATFLGQFWSSERTEV